MRFVCWLVLAAPFTLVAAEPWTLETAVAQALTNNPDAVVAGHRINAARAVISQANSGFWPHLQLQSSYLWTDNPVNVFGAALNQSEFSFGAFDLNDPPTVDHLNARGLLTVPIYTGGTLRATRESAIWRARKETENEAVVRAVVAFEVARTFHILTKARELIRSVEATVAAFENHLRVANDRFEAGTILKSEALDVEVQLARARDELIRARNSEALTKRGLQNLLGIEGEEEFRVSETVTSMAAPNSRDVSKRPEIHAARDQVKAAEAEVRRAKGGGRPWLGAFASYDHDRGAELGGAGNSWTAGALVRWDVWDGRLTRAKVREATARLQEAQEEERKIRMRIDLELTEATLQLESAGERLRATEKAVEHAEESVSTVRARFEQGRELSARLIDAETALISARVRRAEAEADERIAAAAIRRALGIPQVEGGVQ